MGRSVPAPADRASRPIFKPAWRGDLAAVRFASALGDAREACESLESRGAVPVGWFTDGSRRFAPSGSSVGDVMLSDDAESPSKMPPPVRGSELASAGVAGLLGAVLAVASSAASVRSGVAPRSPLSRALFGAAAGVMSVVDGDASHVARVVGSHGFARPALLPQHPWQAASIAALGAADIGRAEGLALEASARLGGAGARVVWRVLERARGSSRWRPSGAWLGGEAWGVGRTAADFAKVAAESVSGADPSAAAVPIHELWSMGLGFESAWPSYGTVCVVCPRCPVTERDAEVSEDV